jgi:hypothetical protein
VICAKEPKGGGLSVCCAGSWQPSKRLETAIDANNEDRNLVGIMAI